MTKDPTLEETLDGLLHHRTPGPLVFFVEVGVSLLELFPVVFQTLVEGGVLRMTGPVGASEGHALLGPVKKGTKTNGLEIPRGAE